MLEVRSVNLMELAAALPHEIGTTDHRYQYIERQLKNPGTDCDAVMAVYAREVVEKLAAQGRVIILQLDQSHINNTNKILMFPVCMCNCAVTVAWMVRTTKGNIGFTVQRELLESVLAYLPSGIAILLAADCFCGTAALIGWCQKAGWSWRVRLKDNLTLDHQGEELTTGEIATRQPVGLLEADLYGSGVKIQRPERLERLILVMSIALYWAVSCGMFDEHQAAGGGQKRGL